MWAHDANMNGTSAPYATAAQVAAGFRAAWP
jgi:hypothetical protein